MNHSFDVNVACKIGLEKAILIQHIGYWLIKNKANHTCYKDGSYWTYTSSEALAEIFPYLNSRSIRRYMTELERDGYLKSAQFKKQNFWHIKYYALTNEGCKLINLPEDFNSISNSSGQTVQTKSGQTDHSNIYNNNNNNNNREREEEIVDVNELEIKYTIDDVKECGVLLGLSEEECEAAYHHYNAQGWKRANGLPITNLASLLSTWRAKVHKFKSPQDEEENRIKQFIQSLPE